MVAMAIQGLTPDLHDLSSSRAFRLLCPYLEGQNPSPPEDESPDDVCELMRWARWPERSPERMGFDLASRGELPQTAWLPIAHSNVDVEAVPFVRLLVYELCRLTC
jgi:hypothetical protein